MFQNYAVLDSNKTKARPRMNTYTFQNYAVLDSNKTTLNGFGGVGMFQNYAVLDSNKTHSDYLIRKLSFRIMLFQIVTKLCYYFP